MKVNKSLFIFFTFSILVSNSFKSADEMYSYEIFFVEPKSSDAHFGVNIKVKVKDGHYMSSAYTSEDPFAAITSIIWPDYKGCYDNSGRELLECKSVNLIPLYWDEEECAENSGNWVYGNWMIDKEKYYDKMIFEKISDLIENKKPSMKQGTYIQRGEFEIYQEYTLVGGLEPGLYNFKGIFEHQVCEDKGMCLPIFDMFSKAVKILNNNYEIKFNSQSASIGLDSCKEEF